MQYGYTTAITNLQMLWFNYNLFFYIIILFYSKNINAISIIINTEYM